MSVVERVDKMQAHRRTDSDGLPASLLGLLCEGIFTLVARPGAVEALSRLRRMQQSTSFPVDLIAEAYKQRDWLALGYTSWETYCTAVFGSGPSKSRTTDRRSVYFIQADSGLVKVGVAENPQARLAQLQTGSPARLRLIGFVPEVGAQGERALHVRFAAAHAHGEWFHPVPELMDYVRSMNQDPTRDEEADA